MMNNSDTDQNTVEPLLSPAASSKNLGRIMVVDDEKELLHAILDMLSDVGYETTGFSSPLEALEMLEEGLYDVLITDMMMPELDGIDLIGRALEFDPDLVAVLMTGQGTIQTAIEAMKSGAFDYILKPFKLRPMLITLDRAMELRRTRLENVQLRHTVAVYELGQAISHATDTNAILGKIVDAAMAQCDADESSIMLPTNDGTEFYVAESRGPGKAFLRGERVPIDRGIAGKVAREKRTVILRGKIEDDSLSVIRTGATINHSVSSPLLSGGELVGVLNVNATRRKRPFSLGQIKGLSVLATIAAVTLEDVVLKNKLLQAEKKFRGLLDSAPDSMIAIDTEGTIVFANNQTEALFGYRPEEAIGMSIDLLVQGELRKQHATSRDEYLQSPTIRVVGSNGQLQGLHKDGSVFPAEITLSPVETDDGLIVISAVRDITDRKEAQAALLKSEERYRSIFEQSNDAIYMATLTGNLIDFNEAACDLFGYTRDEIMTMNGADFYEDPQHRDEMLRRIEEAGFASGFETRMLRKDGTVLHVVLNTVARRDEAGAIFGLQGIVRDVTHERELETQLRRTQRLESLGTLAGGIAHDFNNILSSVIGYTQMGLRGLNEGEELHDDLSRVLNAGMRAKDLVQQILTFSRQVDGKRSKVGLHLIIKEVLDLLEVSLPPNISVESEFSKNTGSVIADPTQMHQVVMNLCTNSYHAMKKSGGVLSVSLSPATECQETGTPIPKLPEGEWVCLTIRDTGMGMDETTLERIFDPFFTTKAPGEGTGLGMSTTHGIVTSHGGVIDIQSSPGKGTTICVCLPGTKPTSLQQSSTCAPLQRGHESIVVVDDDEQCATLSEKLLQELGYEVTVFTDSVKALECVRREDQPFDLMITDYAMPGIYGLELARELLQAKPTLPVILLTGSAAFELQHCDDLQNLKALVRKPFSINEITHTVRKVLDETNIRDY